MNKVKRKIISLIVVFALALGHISYVEFNLNVFAESINNNYSCDYYEVTNASEISKSISKIFSKYNIDDTLNLLMIGCDKEYILDPSLVGNAIGIVRDLKYGGYDICYRNLEDLQSAKVLLESDPNIEYVQKNEEHQYIYDPIQNNSKFNITSDLNIDDDWGVKAIKIREYIRLLDSETKNREIKIAVLDSGISYNHPLFKGRLEKGYDFVNKDDDPKDDHVLDHGTHVAGIIANALQGLNYKIVPYKVTNYKGEGTLEALYYAIQYAIKDGCSVINMSLGVPKAGIYEKCPCVYIHNEIENALNNNICVVAGAGNDNIDASAICPAHIQHRDDAGRNDVICVGNIYITESDTKGRQILKAEDSNYGSSVDVYAPGTNIISAGKYNNYIEKSGTSMATPFVSAMAAVYKAGNPSLKCREIEDKIKENAYNIQLSFKNKDNIDVIEDTKFATFANQVDVELFPVYRLFNKTNQEHYYTINESEKNKLEKQGWKYEGKKWYSPRKYVEGSVRVYKLYNKKLDRHLFTAKEGEVRKLEKIGWELKNNRQPVFYSWGDIEIFRLYNPNNSDHLLTTSEAERDKRVAEGWIYEENATLYTKSIY